MDVDTLVVEPPQGMISSPVTHPANPTTLVVDLDGTLTPTDTLVESVILLLKQHPLDLFRLPLWLMLGRAGFKQIIASHTHLPVIDLPWRAALIEYLQEEKAKGRRIVLATAAHHDIADLAAQHLGLFDYVISSDEHRNLKGAAKLDAIRELVGDDFIYVGDSAADLPIWKAAHGAILVGVSRGVARSVREDNTYIEREFPREVAGASLWLRALRVHQWIKNLLLFVPMLTAFSFLQPGKLVAMATAFLAFSLAASATYIANDLWDLENDRAHPRKRQRPFASGAIPIPQGVAVAGLALTTAFVLATTVSPGFVAMLLLYLVLTSTYTWVLKEYVLMDVLMLALLYTLRIVAGAVALGIATSSWLLAFSAFIFLSLALVKRCSELVLLEQRGKHATQGRDYRVTDLTVLWPLGVGAALSSVVVFGLFISAPETQARYASPQLLWLVAFGLVYWLGRLWIKTARGEMHDDPVLFAMKDRGSRITVCSLVLTTLLAHFVALGMLT
ncbi:UbiA family prenyltransferase [Chitinimonas naiadis]